MMRLFRLCVLISLMSLSLLSLISVVSVAQSEDDLTITDAQARSQTDAFDNRRYVIEAQLVNTSDDVAYSNIVAYADVLNATDEVIAEAFGVPVNACGIGLLPDFSLQPGETQSIVLDIEFFEPPSETALADIAGYEFFPEGMAVEPRKNVAFSEDSDLKQISTQEVVMVEWLDGNSLRFGVGCDADLYPFLQWSVYDPVADAVNVIGSHPRASLFTSELLQATGLDDPDTLRHSFLSRHPNDRRLIYQDRINTMITVEPDGTFKRLLWDDLSRVSLHGFIWLPEGRFLAYYYGAYGDPVRYFTASTAGALISPDVYSNTPSFTVPGVTQNGANVIITQTVDGVTGYYFKALVGTRNDLLFEAEPPGNNYPAPVYVVTGDGTSAIYIIRDVNDSTVLQCYEMATGELHMLTPVPLNLNTDDRAWSMISPDNTQLAIYANGQSGGLWLADLTQYPECLP